MFDVVSASVFCDPPAARRKTKFNEFQDLCNWPRIPSFRNFIYHSPAGALAGGIAAIAGHNWSLFLGFKGGRGVATALGVIIVIKPKVTAIVFFVWAVIVYFTRYVSLGSIVAAFVAPPLIWLLGERTEYLYFGVVAALFVIVRHRPNIERLLRGEELKIKAGSAAPDKKDEDKP